jgi:phage recombination protein Bet
MSIANTDIALASGTSSALANGTVTPEQIELIKNTILKPKDRVASNDELALFIGQCSRTGLDPFARQIYGIFRKEKQGTRWVEKMTIQTGIDGFRVVAQRSNAYGGQDGPFWQDADGQWHESWPKAKGLPSAAKVIARKVIGGQVVETPAIANFDEFAPRYPDGNLMGLWPQMPAHMIAKCAEALALRKAFPQELSGIYTADEMERTDLEAEVLVARPVLEEPIDVAELVTAETVEELKILGAGLSGKQWRLALSSVGAVICEPFNPLEELARLRAAAATELATTLADLRAQNEVTA